MNDARLKKEAQKFLDYVLAHQGSDEWIGPEPRFLWARYPFLLGAMGVAQADPSQTTKIVNAMHKVGLLHVCYMLFVSLTFVKFVKLSNDMLKKNQGMEEWTRTRWQDYQLVLQWLVRTPRWALDEC